jgi:hypothetical protein
MCLLRYVQIPGCELGWVLGCELWINANGDGVIANEESGEGTVSQEGAG